MVITSLPPHNFTAHNILLPDGTETIPDLGWLASEHPWLLSAQRFLKQIIPHPGGRRLVDLGCLEGGYALEFARSGFDTLGIDVRQSNIANCDTVARAFDLDNLRFVRDDVQNLSNHGRFDVAFCCGLLYHLDRPKAFIQQLAACADIAIINTHFAADTPSSVFSLSDLTENEGLPGRWFFEHDTDNPDERETMKWAAWDNRRSFWLTKPAIFQALADAGYDIVLEQLDQLAGFHGETILQNMSTGYYATMDRSTFIGIRAKP